MTVYFFDDRQQLIKVVPKRNLIECYQEKEVTQDASDLIRNNINVTLTYDKELEEASFLAVEEEKESFSMFRVPKATKDGNTLIFDGTDFAPNELDGSIVKDIRPRNELIQSVATRLLDGTGWTVLNVDSGLGRVSGSFYYTSVKEALKTLQTYGCEIEFRCRVEGDGIKAKWINIRKRIGKETGRRFIVGHNTLKVVKQINRSNVYTSLIGRGRGEEVGETEQGEATYGRRIEFADIVWSKAKGDPLDKPRGQIFLEDKEMTKLYGIPIDEKTMKKRESVVIFEDEEDPKKLLEKTYEQLKYLSRPLIEFKTEVLEADDLGNIVSIHDYENGYHYETRVFKTTLDRLTGKAICFLGDKVTQNMSEKQAQQVNVVKDLQTNKTSFYDTNKVSKYQDDVIRGASEEGGNVFLMSPSDLGINDSRAPFQTVWMNGPNLAESDNFLVANNKGIGFIKGKFDVDKFATAWTIDGILTLGEGMLQLGSDRLGKFMQNTADGLEFLNTETTIGTIGTSAKNFPGFPGENTDSKALSIELEDGSFFKIQTSGDSKKATGIYVPNPKKPLEPGFGTDFIIAHQAAKGAIHIVGEKTSIFMYEDKIKMTAPGGFYLNNEQVFPGGGGSGGGTGGGNLGSREEYARNYITDEFDVDYEKMYQKWLTFGRIQAWGLANKATFNELNEIIRSEGVSPVFFWAYEGGEGYHPDLSFLNHFYKDGSSYQNECRRTAKWVKSTAYTQGELAWYDAQYLYYASPPDKQAVGNAYMAETKGGMIARVMLQGTAAATWAMFDPAALSGSVNGVQDYADPFKHQMNLISSWQGVRTYGKPMTQYTVTSEFGWRDSPLNPGTMEFHNAIDLASSGGRGQIFASSDGEVVKADGVNWDWYGNYVVIKHQDGLFTGYAHLSRIDVKVGQKVSKGQLIGIEGATGPVTGPHLHFQFMKKFWPESNDDFINPRKYINF